MPPVIALIDRGLQQSDRQAEEQSATPDSATVTGAQRARRKPAIPGDTVAAVAEATKNVAIALPPPAPSATAIARTTSVR